MKQLETDFQTCSTIDNDLDLAVLYSDLMGNVQGTVQYNRESKRGTSELLMDVTCKQFGNISL